jgi:hypothetical protein
VILPLIGLVGCIMQKSVGHRAFATLMTWFWEFWSFSSIMPGFFILTLMSITEMELKKPFTSLTGSFPLIYLVFFIAIFTIFNLTIF